mmetsp:Transcript_67018/g.160244  ORF Transcript_67018/g.160244 Transcript_67018/m.160244 type:complete len:123 (+) Transcript_67018:624-992(+)
MGRCQKKSCSGRPTGWSTMCGASSPTSKTKKAIPDIRTDKNAWFAFFDEDGSGALDQEEVVRGVVQTFKLSSDLDRVRMLREILGAVWLEFDHDGGGTVDKKEFLAPGIGLADTLIATMGYA